MLDRNYQDDNRLYSDHGLAYGFNDLDLVAIDPWNLSLRK